jgi:adenylate kinase
VLVEKCLGRRICSKCGKNYNIADIYLPASEGRPEIAMPPLSPPPECIQHMEQRSDDTQEVIRHRLQVRLALARAAFAGRRDGWLDSMPWQGGQAAGWCSYWQGRGGGCG